MPSIYMAAARLQVDMQTLQFPVDGGTYLDRTGRLTMLSRVLIKGLQIAS